MGRHEPTRVGAIAVGRVYIIPTRHAWWPGIRSEFAEDGACAGRLSAPLMAAGADTRPLQANRKRDRDEPRPQARTRTLGQPSSRTGLGDCFLHAATPRFD